MRTKYLPRAGSVPAERDLIEDLVAELFRRARHGLAAERAIELDGGLVVRQRPYHQAFLLALHEVAPRRHEQPAAEAEALKLGAQVKLVDLALILQAAGAVVAVVGIARHRVAEGQER